MRAIAATLTLVAVVTATSGVAANPRSEKIRLRPADVALAKRSVLRQADVGPDWARVATSRKTDSQFACSSFQPDFSSFTITAQIDSTVAVFRTRAQAAGDFRRGAKPELAACLADQVRRAFRSYPKDVRGRLLSSKMVKAP
jgi:hypothetical protein